MCTPTLPLPLGREAGTSHLTLGESRTHNLSIGSEGCLLSELSQNNMLILFPLLVPRETASLVAIACGTERGVVATVRMRATDDGGDGGGKGSREVGVGSDGGRGGGKCIRK